MTDPTLLELKHLLVKFRVSWMPEDATSSIFTQTVLDFLEEPTTTTLATLTDNKEMTRMAHIALWHLSYPDDIHRNGSAQFRAETLGDHLIKLAGLDRDEVWEWYEGL